MKSSSSATSSPRRRARPHSARPRRRSGLSATASDDRSGPHDWFLGGWLRFRGNDRDGQPHSRTICLCAVYRHDQLSAASVGQQRHRFRCLRDWAPRQTAPADGPRWSAASWTANSNMPPEWRPPEPCVRARAEYLSRSILAHPHSNTGSFAERRSAVTRRVRFGHGHTGNLQMARQPGDHHQWPGGRLSVCCDTTTVRRARGLVDRPGG